MGIASRDISIVSPIFRRQTRCSATVGSVSWIQLNQPGTRSGPTTLDRARGTWYSEVYTESDHSHSNSPFTTLSFTPITGATWIKVQNVFICIHFYIIMSKPSLNTCTAVCQFFLLCLIVSLFFLFKCSKERKTRAKGCLVCQLRHPIQDHPSLRTGTSPSPSTSLKGGRDSLQKQLTE